MFRFQRNAFLLGVSHDVPRIANIAEPLMIVYSRQSHGRGKDGNQGHVHGRGEGDLPTSHFLHDFLRFLHVPRDTTCREKMIEHLLGQRHIFCYHLVVEVERPPQIVRPSRTCVYQLRVRDVCRGLSTGSHVIVHVQCLLCLCPLCCCLDHHSEEHLVGLDVLPRACVMEGLPGFLQFVAFHTSVNECSVDDHVPLQTLVLHFPEEGERRIQISLRNMCLDQGPVDFRSRLQHFRPHSQKEQTRGAGVFLHCGCLHECHVGVPVCLKSEVPHFVKYLQGVVEPSLESPRLDHLIEVLCRP
mmetsp:Transcript_2329/g.4915  ORF Transcript_2329/g.4915 Transcript_2329/m.4915 type:complete len:300 (+) Transcript_2329:822-1721(+)